jgi:hypothetical protein
LVACAVVPLFCCLRIPSAGMAPVMMPAAGMQQYAAAPYQWSQGSSMTMRMMPPSTTGGYVYSQSGP